MELDREAAWRLLNEYTHGESLLRHAIAVEACMRWYADFFGEDPERWGITGLLHDMDYEKWPAPEHHPLKGAAILAERGYPEDVIEAIKGHANYLGVPRESRMAKALYACDELAGFTVAVALVRPSKKVADVKVSSVKKKLKSKAFAQNVSREEIAEGAEELGVPLDEHIAHIIEALTQVAAEIGLDG